MSCLVRRYSTPLFNFIYRFVGDYDQACDVLQQVFLQFYLSLPSLRIGDPFKAWLFQVARNRCLDELRRKRAIRFSELEPVNDEDEMSPLAALPDTLHVADVVLRENKDPKELFLTACNRQRPPKRKGKDTTRR